MEPEPVAEMPVVAPMPSGWNLKESRHFATAADTLGFEHIGAVMDVLNRTLGKGWKTEDPETAWAELVAYQVSKAQEVGE